MGNGIISGFLGGMGKGAADAGKILLMNQLSQERDEANDLRRRAMQTQRQGFLTGEREAGQTFTASESDRNRKLTKSESEEDRGFKSGENELDRDYKTINRNLEQSFKSDENALDRGFKSDENAAEREWKTQENTDEREWKSIENELDRWSAEDISEAKNVAAAAKDGSTTKMKEVRDLMANGNKTFTEAVGVVYPGAQIQYTNVEGERMVAVMDKDGYKELGRFVVDEKGKGRFLNEGEELPNAPITRSHRNKAKENASNKAGWKSTDKTDFSSTGGDRQTWIREESQRIANEERAGKKGTGIVNSAATPPAVASKPVQKAKQKFPEGTELKNKKDGKIYVIKNGKPVLKTPQ